MVDVVGSRSVQGAGAGARCRCRSGGCLSASFLFCFFLTTQPLLALLAEDVVEDAVLPCCRAALPQSGW